MQTRPTDRHRVSEDGDPDVAAESWAKEPKTVNATILSSEATVRCSQSLVVATRSCGRGGGTPIERQRTERRSDRSHAQRRNFVERDPHDRPSRARDDAQQDEHQPRADIGVI